MPFSIKLTDGEQSPFYDNQKILPALLKNFLYYDMINFLHNMRLKVSDEHLNVYTQKERQSMVKQYQGKIDQLEKMTGPRWGYGSPMDGWAMIFDYIQA